MTVINVNSSALGIFLKDGLYWSLSLFDSCQKLLRQHRELGPGRKDVGRPGAMLDQLTTRTPPLHYPLHKNAEIADSLPPNRLLPYRCPNHYCAQLIKVLPLITPSWGGDDELSTLLPPERRHKELPGNIAQRGSPPFSKSLPFQPGPLVPRLEKLPSRARPGISSEVLPFLYAASLVFEHKLSKICLENFLGFPLNFYLREPQNPKQIANNTIKELSNTAQMNRMRSLRTHPYCWAQQAQMFFFFYQVKFHFIRNVTF